MEIIWVSAAFSDLYAEKLVVKLENLYALLYMQMQN